MARGSSGDREFPLFWDVDLAHMDDCYATIAQKWFGVPAAEVIKGGSPLTGIIDP